MTKKLKLGIPGGALEESIKKLFQGAGFDFEIKEKPLIVYVDDPEIECFFDRANEIALLIGKGILDGGIISKAALVETKIKAAEICKIDTPNADWGDSRVVLAVPENSSIKKLGDLRGKKIITRLPEITKAFLKKNKIPAEVEFSYTSNEPKVPVLADAVVEFTNTGATLQFYKLKILAVLLEKANMLYVIGNPKILADKWKKEKIENIGLLLQGARAAQDMVGLTLHASNNMMEEVFKVLPAMKKPTVTHLRGENWFEVFTVADKKKTRELIPKLKKIGCTDIVEFPLNLVIN